MNTMNANRRYRSPLPALAVGAIAMLVAGPALAGTNAPQVRQVMEQVRQQREQHQAERAPREQGPPRAQPGRPPGGNFAGRPQPPRGNPDGSSRPPGDNAGGNFSRPDHNRPRPPDGNANVNRPPRPDSGNWRPGNNRPPQGNGNNWRPGDNRPPRGDDNNWRPGNSRPPQGNSGNWRPGYGKPPQHPGRPGYRPPPRYVPSLPPGYARHYWNGSPYYYGGGYWYRPWGTSFAIVSAPYGLFVPYLPSAYSTVWYGGSRYFFADSTYYLYDNTRRGYVVTPSPYGDDQDDAAGSALDEQLYVYPAQGQSDQQMADDRYECHRWAVEQAGYDPVDADYDAARRAEYQRALAACLTGRGYTVR